MLDVVYLVDLQSFHGFGQVPSFDDFPSSCHGICSCADLCSNGLLVAKLSAPLSLGFSCAALDTSLWGKRASNI